METLNLVLRWLHVLSAITMVGGVFYLRFAVLPLLESMPEEQRESFGAALRRNWAKFVMISILLLLVTGITNMVLIPKTIDPEFRSNYSMLVGIKFMLAIVVFGLISLLNGRSANAAKFREKSRLWLNITVALCVVIVCLGGHLRFVPRAAKSNDSAEPAAVSLHLPAQAKVPSAFFSLTWPQNA